MEESLGYKLVFRKRVSQEEWIRTVYEHARELSRILGEEILVNRKVLEAELEKWEREGAPWCVCRFQRTPKEVCPCTYHLEELRKFGRCKCGLFWTRSACRKFIERAGRKTMYCREVQ